MAMVITCSCPLWRPVLISRSAARAASSAASVSTDTKAWTTGSTRWMRSRQARVNSTGETDRVRTACAASARDRQGQSVGAAAISDLLVPRLDAEDGDRLDVV